MLIELANRFKEKLPQAKEVIEKFTYMDDANIFGNNTDGVVEKALQVIKCLEHGSFKVGKILSDNKAILKAMPQESLHPAILDAFNDK